MFFQERPKRIEAMQFKGGIEDARQLLEWLIAKHITTGSYMPEILDDGHIIEREHLQIRSCDGLQPLLRVLVGQWIVLDPTCDLYVTTSHNLFQFYEEAPDVVPGSASDSALSALRQALQS